MLYFKKKIKKMNQETTSTSPQKKIEFSLAQLTTIAIATIVFMIASTGVIIYSFFYSKNNSKKTEGSQDLPPNSASLLRTLPKTVSLLESIILPSTSNLYNCTKVEIIGAPEIPSKNDFVIFNQDYVSVSDFSVDNSNNRIVITRQANGVMTSMRISTKIKEDWLNVTEVISTNADGLIKRHIVNNNDIRLDDVFVFVFEKISLVGDSHDVTSIWS